MSLSLLTQNVAKPWLPIRCGTLTCTALTADSMTIPSLTVTGALSAGSISANTVNSSTATTSVMNVSGPLTANTAQINNSMSVAAGIQPSNTSDYIQSFTVRVDSGNIEANGFSLNYIPLYNCIYKVLNEDITVQIPPFVIENSNQVSGNPIFWQCPSSVTSFKVGGVGFYRDTSSGGYVSVIYEKEAGNSQGTIRPADNNPNFNSSGGDYQFQNVLLSCYLP